MKIKYCKDCVNFSPLYSHHKLTPDEDFSWGYCRIISQLEISNNTLRIMPKQVLEFAVEKSVPANQVIVVEDFKICPAYSNLSDIFQPEGYIKQIADIDLLKKLYYLKCKNCNHLFASLEKETQPYTCPICFHSDEYKSEEHFRRPAEFVNKQLL